ncbi:DUF4238 domain-containing protein [Ectopseudomonas mendocina]|uniref:DUF4238 domain-containing protein n=1 Tax=Ectopseudomonas mendocina TaxID=300 RepID=A0A2R3QVF8_ECTME|nr:DUF4238 domain-containing protein [Pseudomonas mendocina]AVO55738.1 hypothetical protein C7A17_24285 [Pseudomonas mendocina]
MATNKNQHFVPRCYLRPFTVDGKNTAINLFNIDRELFIPNAPVKNQCSRDYFYGQDDQLEQAIQTLEGAYASTSKEVLANIGQEPTDEQKDILRMFWLFQYLRTEAAAKRSLDSSSAMIDSVEAAHLGYKIELKEAVRIAMKIFATAMHKVHDLKVCLIHNKSKTPLITSDDPAILTNRWHFLNPQRAGLSFGLERSGTLALLPLSPEVYFVAYDADVYSLSLKKGWIATKNDSDIDSLNQHQYLNCRANIFIKSPDNLESIATGFKHVVSRRIPCRHVITHSVLDKVVDGYKHFVVVDAETAKKHEESIIHTQSVHPQPKSWPMFLGWRNGGTVYTNGTAVGYVRKAIADSHLSGPVFYKQKAFNR